MAGVYEAYMAEYVLGFLLLRTQEVDRIRASQAARAWEPFEKACAAGLDDGDRGHRARRLGGRALRGGVRDARLGLCRDPAGRAAHSAYERVYGSDERDEFLAGLDVLVLAMPVTPNTRGMIDAGRARGAARRGAALQHQPWRARRRARTHACARRGRGRRRRARHVRRRAAAAESPLWALPNVTVTPHNSGAVHAHELGVICARHLAEFVAGRLPEPLVDLSRGY